MVLPGGMVSVCWPRLPGVVPVPCAVRAAAGPASRPPLNKSPVGRAPGSLPGCCSCAARACRCPSTSTGCPKTHSRSAVAKDRRRTDVAGLYCGCQRLSRALVDGGAGRMVHLGSGGRKLLSQGDSVNARAAHRVEPCAACSPEAGNTQLAGGIYNSCVYVYAPVVLATGR